MKKKNGFISISIIYSFFIVFLLLLVLIMTTYTTNRYEFNIFTKDEKRYHAENTSILPNNNDLISYSNLDGHAGYYSYYYYRDTDGSISNATNYFFYPSSNINIGEMNVSNTTNIYVILGSFTEHTLDYNSFFDNSTAFRSIENIKTHTKFDRNQTDNNIVIAPSLPEAFVSWSEAIKNPSTLDDLQNGIINSLIGVLTKKSGVKTKNDITNLNIYYIGYDDGGTGIAKYIANYSIAGGNEKYYMIDGNIVCSSVQCTSLDPTELNNLRSRGTSSKFYGYAKDENSITLLDGFFNNIGNTSITHYTDAPDSVIARIITGA